MRFIYLIMLLLFFSCGPSVEEKLKLEEEIKSIKAEMAQVLYNSKELSINYAKYKTQVENLDLAEISLKKVRTGLKDTAIGTGKHLELETAEITAIKRVAFEKEKLLKMGSIDSVEIRLQSFSKKYDSLNKSLKEKTGLLK